MTPIRQSIAQIEKGGDSMRLIIATVISIAAGVGAGCVTYGLYLPTYDVYGLRWKNGKTEHRMSVDAPTISDEERGRAENRAAIVGIGTGFIVAGSAGAVMYLFGLILSAIEYHYGRRENLAPRS
jgi:hypothetical protein